MRFVELKVSVLALVLASAAWAGPLIPYQGRLDRNGKPLTGTYNLQFSLYDGPSGGNLLWQDTFSNVAVVAGAFSVKLGSGLAIDPLVLRNPAVFVSIAVEGPGETSFTTLAGRQQLLTQPYATGSQQDFAVSGNLAVSSGRIDGGVAFAVSGDGGTAAMKLNSGNQTLTIDGQSVNSTTTLGVQTNGQPAQFGGNVGVTGNLGVSGSVTGNNIGKKIFDTNGYAGLPISFSLDVGSPHTYRVYVDGIIGNAINDNYLELRVNGATSGYQSQLYFLGTGNSYINKSDGFILAWNVDRTNASFNNALTVTAALNQLTFACYGVNVAGNFNISEFSSGAYFFGVTGGSLCATTPNAMPIQIVNSGSAFIWQVHVVVYQLD